MSDNVEQYSVEVTYSPFLRKLEEIGVDTIDHASLGSVNLIIKLYITSAIAVLYHVIASPFQSPSSFGITTTPRFCCKMNGLYKRFFLSIS